MKKLLKYILYTFATIYAFLALKSCLGLFYYKMTHLSKEDLRWTHALVGKPSVKFISDSGNISKLSLVSVSDNDKYNPIYISSNGSKYFEANSWYQFEITDSIRTLNGSLGIARLVDVDSLCAQYRLGAMFSKGHSYQIMQLSNFDLHGKIIDNCLIIDSTLVRASKHWKNRPEQMVEKFVISKDYGPIYYKLPSGEEFYRVMEIK
ncbi:MAG: hypothetical protein K2H48_03575 [Duncaniella sp.]|nr:hypothetical protein [Duncaniella sp.]